MKLFKLNKRKIILNFTFEERLNINYIIFFLKHIFKKQNYNKCIVIC